MRRTQAFVFTALLLSACTLQRWQQPGRSMALDDHMMHMSAADMRAPIPSTITASGNPQGTPGLPASNNAAAARLAASPRHSEWVKIAWAPGSPDSIMAWVVYPKTNRKAPVVVVVHEIFGLSTWVRGVADQVAAEGFIAIAPDFLSKVRGGPTTVELPGDSAQKLIRGYTSTDQAAVIDAAANYAMMLPAAEQKYAVIGYCWGGTATWSHAINGGVMGFSGGVAFYGTPPTGGGQRATASTPAVPATLIADSVAKITKPIMLLSGSKDARITALMPAIDSMMKAMHKDYSYRNYEGAVHGFLRAQDDPKATRDEAEEAANLAATKDGWPRTVAFLKKILDTK
ncbi:MAG TPA: dienelactone hydrolase family protein [Gemmatimonadaceae bacterium]|nr:dienelactone hydrolase family protein [Gemmatimonadaceae bacterium]